MNYIMLVFIFLCSLEARATNAVPSPENTVCAFDMHHTLVEPDVRGMVKVGLKHFFKIIKLLILLPFDTIRYLITGNGSHALFVHELCKLGFTSPGAAYKEIVEKYDPELWETVAQMATTMKPIPGMEDLAHELKSLGYTLRIATNGSGWEVDTLRKKLSHLFEPFESEAQTVESTTVTHKKPDISYFTQYLKRFDNGKAIILIDDHKNNIISSQQAGMTGILFKNADQLRADLIALGIPLKPLQHK